MEGSVIDRRVVVSWSTGKDAAWCLRTLRRESGDQVIGLLSTVTRPFRRVTIHGTRLEVLRAQAAYLGLPVWLVELPYPCSNEAYEEAMGRAVAGMLSRWAPTHVAFGDLFLEDVRAYREERLSSTPLEPLFPLWGRDTKALAREMQDEGLSAVIVSAPTDSGASQFVGQPWSPETVSRFPDDVDPCGENGEFHTCFIGGAGMDPLPVALGEVVERDGARYCDLGLRGP
ncbi:MAG: hypothetical protein AMXMBFR53_35270 [Gemmatimonadota bacterium]